MTQTPKNIDKLMMTTNIKSNSPKRKTEPIELIAYNSP